MKNPAAVSLGRIGGQAKSEKKKAAVLLNLEKAWEARKNPDRPAKAKETALADK